MCIVQSRIIETKPTITIAIEIWGNKSLQLIQSWSIVRIIRQAQSDPPKEGTINIRTPLFGRYVFTPSIQEYEVRVELSGIDESGIAIVEVRTATWGVVRDECKYYHANRPDVSLGRDVCIPRMIALTFWRVATVIA